MEEDLKISALEEKQEKAKRRKERLNKERSERAHMINYGASGAKDYRTDRPNSDYPIKKISHKKREKRILNQDLDDVSVEEKRKPSQVSRDENLSQDLSFENRSESTKIMRRPNRNSASVTTRDDDISAKMAKFNQKYTPSKYENPEGRLDNPV